MNSLTISLNHLSEIEALIMGRLYAGKHNSLDELLEVGDLLLAIAEFKLSLADGTVDDE